MTTNESFGVHSLAPSFFTAESAWRHSFSVRPLRCACLTHFRVMGFLGFCSRRGAGRSTNEGRTAEGGASSAL